MPRHDDNLDPFDPANADLPAPAGPGPIASPAPRVLADPGFACSTEDHWVQYFPVRFANGTGDLKPAHRSIFRDVLDLIFLGGGFIIDNPTANASALGLTRQAWGPARDALLSAGKLERVMVEGRGGVYYLTNPKAYEVVCDAATRSATAKHKAKKRWENKQARRAAGDAAAHAAADAAAYANEHEHESPYSPPSSRPSFNPGTGYDAKRRLVSLPGSTIPQPATIAQFLAGLCRDLGADAREAENSLNPPDWLHRLLQQHPARHVADIVARMAFENQKSGFVPNSPVAYLRKQLPEKLEQLDGSAPQSQADFDRETLQIQIRTALLKPGLPGKLNTPRQFRPETWAQLFGPPPAQPGCKVSIAQINQALEPLGFTWDKGAATVREIARNPR